MSWFKALLLLLPLSACGFEPMYAQKNAGGQEIVHARPAITLANIPDRDGQYLRNLLLDRLGARGEPAYTLAFTPLQKNIVSLGIQKDATATRAQIQISTHMTLTDNATNKPVLERDLKAFGAYNVLDNQIATLVAQQGITESVLGEMADDVVTQLDLHFRRRAAATENTMSAPSAGATPPDAAPQGAASK